MYKSHVPFVPISSGNIVERQLVDDTYIYVKVTPSTHRFPPREQYTLEVQMASGVLNEVSLPSLLNDSPFGVENLLK